MRALLALHQGAALTDEERQAIVKTGLGEVDMDGLLKNMHEDVSPILDTIDEYARTFAPSMAAGAAQAGVPGGAGGRSAADLGCRISPAG